MFRPARLGPVGGSARLLFAACAVFLAAQVQATACPFCRSVSATFSDRMAAASVVVRARLLEVPDPDAPANLVRTWPYQVEEVLKGGQYVRPGQRVMAPRLDRPETGTQVVILGADPPDIYWAVPVVISDRAWSYIKQLPRLPSQGAARLRHFLPLLVDEDPFVAADAYDEFAKAPYESVRKLRPHLNPKWLRAQIEAARGNPSLKRLLFLLLAQCGGEEDAAWLENLLRQPGWQGQQSRWLDAAIACYLSLRGAAGLELVRTRFLQDPDTPFSETYAAVLALRFHGQQEKLIPRPLLIAALHDVLDRPRLVDLVLPDLARWEDWSLVERLGRLFDELGPQEQFVRPAIVRYMLVCPRPEAKRLLARWEAEHPRLVRQARLLPGGTTRAVATRSESRSQGKKSGTASDKPRNKTGAASDKSQPPARAGDSVQEPKPTLPLVAPEPSVPAGPDTEQPGAKPDDKPNTQNAAQQEQPPPEVTLAERVGAVAGLVFWSLLLLAAYVWLLR